MVGEYVADSGVTIGSSMMIAWWCLLLTTWALDGACRQKRRHSDLPRCFHDCWLTAWLGFGDRDEDYNMMVAGKNNESEEREVWCVERAGREERMGYIFVEKVCGIVGAYGRCWLSCYFVGFHGGIFMIVLWFEGW